MNAIPKTTMRRVVIYTRVSSEEQKEHETIRTQQAQLRTQLALNPEVQFIREYSDDGVSGTIPFGERPRGAELLRDASLGLFSEVWVYRIDRLGRDDIDPLVVWRDLARLGVEVKSLTEGTIDPFMYHIRVAVAAEERRTMLKRMNDGMDEAATQGRYTGGIRPYGYRVVGVKEKARYVPSDTVVLGEMTEADVVRHIYSRLALDRYTCWQVARELNELHIPTLYVVDEREVKDPSDETGVRKHRTRGHWREGRIRDMVKNAHYRGERIYGKRSLKPGRPLIRAEVEPLVTADIWWAAQETLALNASRPKNTTRIYELRTVIKCGHCGRTYTGSLTHGDVWYRCNGKLRQLEPETPCPSKGVKGDHLEKPIWADIERWLSDPGDILAELAENHSTEDEASRTAHEQGALAAALAGCDLQRERLLDAYQRGHVTVDDLGLRLRGIQSNKEKLEERLAALEHTEEEIEPAALDPDLLVRLRSRLPELNAQERQEIVRLLVSEIRIFTERDEKGKGTARAVVTYRFPRPEEDVVVVSTATGKDS